MQVQVPWLSNPPGAHDVAQRNAELALVDQPVHLGVPALIHVEEESQAHGAVVVVHRRLRDARRPRERHLRTHGHGGILNYFKTPPKARGGLA